MRINKNTRMTYPICMHTVSILVCLLTLSFIRDMTHSKWRYVSNVALHAWPMSRVSQCIYLSIRLSIYVSIRLSIYVSNDSCPGVHLCVNLCVKWLLSLCVNLCGRWLMSLCVNLYVKRHLAASSDSRVMHTSGCLCLHRHAHVRMSMSSKCTRLDDYH